jgi:membrane-associated phospholipid phosphatase
MLLLQLANYISIIPLAIILILFYNVILYQKCFKLLVIFILVSFITQLIKTLPYPNNWYKYTKRPIGACNCDYISMDGDVSNRSGMPSGHVSTITFFSIYMHHKTKDIRYLLLIPATMWARYYKKCHNLIQIFMGFNMGLIASLLSIIKINKKI